MIPNSGLRVKTAVLCVRGLFLTGFFRLREDELDSRIVPATLFPL
jgi:hypothetical protein